MEKALKHFEEEKSNQRFRDLFEHIAIGLVICNTDGLFLNVNDPFCKLTGYSQSELLKMSFTDITHPDDLASDLELVRQTLDGKIENFILEKRYIRKDKSIVWVNLTVSLIRDKNNKPDLFFGTIEDISLRKKAELELEHSRKDWRNIFQAINHPTALLDKNHKIIDINDAIVEFSGMSRESIIGSPCFKIFHGKNVGCPPGGCPMHALLKSGKVETFEMEMEAFNGTFLVSCTPMYDETGTLKNIIHIATDITYLKQTEKALKESEIRYRSLMDMAPVGIAVHCDGKVVFANQTSMQMFGAESAEDLIGKSITEIVHPLNLSTSVERIKRLMNGEKGLYPAEDKYICLDGSTKDVQVYASLINYNGKSSAQVIIMDITETKKTKESLAEWERRFSNILNSVNLVSITLDANATITFCNQYLLSLTGYTTEEVVGRNWFELFIPSDFNEQVLSVFTESVKNGNLITNYENDILAKNGKRITIAWNNTLLKDFNSKVIGAASIGENITERKAYETSLKKAQALLAEMGHVAKIGGWEFDVKTQEGTWTEEVALIHDLEPNIATNVALGLSFYINESKDKIEKAVKNAIESGIPYELELEMITAKGNHKWIKTIGQVEKQNDQIVRVYGSFQDVTDWVIIKQELKKAKEMAEESDQLKTAFLQNMSHEIRTPLNAIMGFSEILPDNFDDIGLLTQYSSIINQRGADLLEIIDDILDIAKIESGQLSVNMAECDLHDFFKNLEKFYTEYRVRLKKEEVIFKLNLQCTNNCKFVVIDSGKLKQILTNLITNAFKFTHSGFVELGCKSEDNNFLTFYVRDTGIGIPKEKQMEVFERFKQAKTDTSKVYGGTGLGLSIVKGLLNLLGGEIWLESEPNKGCTFYFTLPYRKE